MNSKTTIVVIIIIIFAAFALWLFQRSRVLQTPPALDGAPASFGEQIFEEAQNPLQDELPETSPLKGYKNPFE